MKDLSDLYSSYTGRAPEAITPLPHSGSGRQYFRIHGTPTVIGVFNNDNKENRAFLYFARHFKKHDLPVPEIFDHDLEKHIYLQEDLGDRTLFSYVETDNRKGIFTARLRGYYQQVLKYLPVFQTKAGATINYNYCYPRSRFDRQSMLWDLNYFKYYFLKLAGIPFDEEKLEEDFHRFMDFLNEAPANYFLYRDFQSRNVMIKDNQVYFIDFQGGRQGALQYDIASLLYDAKANIPHDLREDFLEIYFNELQKHIDISSRQSFYDYYYGFVLIRIMQAMGAYGYRGFFEGKKHFLQSIPYAIANLKWVLENQQLPVKLPELEYALQAITHSQKLQRISQQRTELTVEINSFSYKRGIPVDTSGHGGGFVFDCRALPNPGKYEAYAMYTGEDAPVINFLNEQAEVHKFLENTRALVHQSVKKYIERGFTHLSINFGCTGGQHRSVYCARYLSKKLNDEFELTIILRHREQE
ncbi:MAG: RNase adapter RapZ [Bacteroidales bacterium]